MRHADTGNPPTALPGKPSGCSCPKNTFGACAYCRQFAAMLQSLGCFTDKNRTAKGKKREGGRNHA